MLVESRYSHLDATLHVFLATTFALLGGYYSCGCALRWFIFDKSRDLLAAEP